MKRSPAHVAALMAMLALCVACAPKPEASRWNLLESLFAADEEDARSEAIVELLASGMTGDQIIDCLFEGWDSTGPVSIGWTVQEHHSTDGRTRPFHVYVPETYDPFAAHPVIVFLHGGVGAARTTEEMVPTRSAWEPLAEAAGALLVLPHGDAWATWWNRAGHSNITAALRWAKRHYNVDENRVYLAGFSDGGSGAYWMALHDPTPWAGFICLYGHPTVAAEGPYPCYPRNLLNRPLRVVNGLSDPLYPAATIRPYVEQLRALGVDLAWATYPTGHDLSFLEAEMPELVAFFATTVRDPLPREVVWETADPRVGRCDWVRIDEIQESGTVDEPINLLCCDAQVLLGVYVSELGGPDVAVEGVMPGCVAEAAGVRAGDVLTSIDGVPVCTSGDIRVAMEGRQAGDVIEIGVLRDGTPRDLTAAVPEPFPVYPQAKVTGLIHAVAEGNRIEVRTRNVRRFTLFLSAEQFDLSRSIEVVTNGDTSFRGLVEADPRLKLQRAAADLDRTTVYAAKLVITVSRANDATNATPSS